VFSDSWAFILPATLEDEDDDEYENEARHPLHFPFEGRANLP
jgi:hypothetical protein